MNKITHEQTNINNFIKELEISFKYKKFNNKEELKKWCKSEQPYYKNHNKL